MSVFQNSLEWNRESPYLPQSYKRENLFLGNEWESVNQDINVWKYTNHLTSSQNAAFKTVIIKELYITTLYKFCLFNLKCLQPQKNITITVRDILLCRNHNYFLITQIINNVYFYALLFLIIKKISLKFCLIFIYKTIFWSLIVLNKFR